MKIASHNLHGCNKSWLLQYQTEAKVETKEIIQQLVD